MVYTRFRAPLLLLAVYSKSFFGRSSPVSTEAAWPMTNMARRECFRSLTLRRCPDWR